ncbi:alpha/beta fold hydrolase [Pseudoxanthomonas sp. UTMC 1351]|uniref:alpha/beta fold hydrolase n=1 Tax=Pseudoxanthomonas sp. UTMC 1351 TaxID=2695853 RepID=UPI0034D01BEA
MIPDAYAAPATRVVLGDGRSINLRCSGQGERVVLFEAGTNADSTTWYRVLPMLKDHARACAYDRAGYGFSDEGPMPRDLNADITDLHELIRTAKLPLPLVLVGHSLGSNIVRGYAQRFPSDVAGMVLVDPPEQGADSAMPEQWKRDDAISREKRNAFLAACAKAAEAEDFLTASAPGCLRPPPAWMGERVAASVKANKAKPGYWRTLRSELTENERVFSTQVSPEERYGEIPLLLLSAGQLDKGAPEEVRAVLKQVRELTHQRIMAASTRSERRLVSDASHDIQLDRPDAVASAVEEMLRLATPHPAKEQ